MRMVRRKDCSYDEFIEMRQEVLDITPWGFVAAPIYDSKNRVAYFYFHDSDYIPGEWNPLWIVRPNR